MTEPKPKLYLGLGRMLKIGPHWQNELHDHYVIQMSLSQEKSFLIRLKDGEWQRTKAVLINSNISHQIKDFDENLIHFSIVPDRRRGINLQKYVLDHQPIKFLDHFDLSYYLNQFRICVKDNQSCTMAFQICENLIDFLTGVQFKANVDNRILKVMSIIQDNISETTLARTLAESIYISEDRFLHLFKEQLGLPLRQYILYQRIMFATKEFLSGKSLTEAAFSAGFSDSAHFSRTFHEINGVKPSILSKYKDIFQIYFCSSLHCDKKGTGNSIIENLCPYCSRL